LTPAWVEQLEADSAAFSFTGFEVGQPEARMDWARVRHAAPDAVWPPKGVALRLDFAPPAGSALKGVTISVHYELYDGIPVLSKWITVRNGSAVRVRLDS